MKNFLFLLLLVLAWAPVAKGHMRDTVWIDLPNGARVFVVTDNLAQYEGLDKYNLDSLLKQLAETEQKEGGPGNTEWAHTYPLGASNEILQDTGFTEISRLPKPSFFRRLIPADPDKWLWRFNLHHNAFVGPGSGDLPSKPTSIHGSLYVQRRFGLGRSGKTYLAPGLGLNVREIRIANPSLETFSDYITDGTQEAKPGGPSLLVDELKAAKFKSTYLRIPLELGRQQGNWRFSLTAFAEILVWSKLKFRYRDEFSSRTQTYTVDLTNRDIDTNRPFTMEPLLLGTELRVEYKWLGLFVNYSDPVFRTFTSTSGSQVHYIQSGVSFRL